MTNADSNVQSFLSSAISAGKSSVRKVEAAEIRSFIEAQPDVIGSVEISDLNGNAEVGASNGIVIFKARYDVGLGPVTRKLVLRHAPGSETRLFHTYDLARQFKVQRALTGSGVPVPEALWLDADGVHLGVPGYIMASVSGEAPNPSAFARGPIARADVADRERMIGAVMDVLVKIHTLDYSACGLDDFMLDAPGDSPMQRCINWYWRTWEWIQLPEYERLKPVHQWLLDHAPKGGTCLMHGDSTLHNYLFVDAQLTAVLDWEMSSLGRAEADLALQCVGNALFAAPPESGALQPPSEQEWIDLYVKAGGKPPEQFEYFKKYSVYIILIALLALQRNQAEEVRAAQADFRNRLWTMLEAG